MMERYAKIGFENEATSHDDKLLRKGLARGKKGSMDQDLTLATVTPSLVILGAPQLCSMITLRPLGPIVTATASARASTPFNISVRALEPNLWSY